MLFWFVIIALTIILIKSNWLWRLDQILYDAHLQFWGRAAPDDIIIIAIDDESLHRLGRWPWSRDIHARLIDILSEENARAVALDIIFAEASQNNRLADRKLADAMSRNGNTILPVLVEQSRSGGQLIETLPISMLANATKALGHVHVELDQDGIARSVYLKGGLGTPHWPNLGLALLQLADPLYREVTMGTRSPSDLTESPLVWTRDHKILIAYAGPPGHFQRISYAQVLEGRFAPGTFTNKLVLIGATAAGLGDALPTPVSGYTHSMPGVEINANIIDTLRNGIDLQDMPETQQMLISALIILIPALLFVHLTPRWNLIITTLLLGLTLLSSFVLLRVIHIWFPPSSVLLALILSYPLWSWRRLENAMQYLNHELSRLHTEQSAIPSDSNIDIAATMKFLAQMLPIGGWALFNMDGKLKAHDGQYPPVIKLTDIPTGQWYSQPNSYWLDMSADPGLGYLGLTWMESTRADKSQHMLLNDLLERYQSQSRSVPADTIELVQARIEQVQQATDRLQALRQFVLDVISQMSDGILVVDPLGNIVLSNERAQQYLAAENHQELNKSLLTDALSVVQIQGAQSWPGLIKDVLLQRRNIQIDAQHQNGRDLLVQIVPLDRSKRELGGLIVNLSDISPLKSSERRRSELLGFLSHDLRSPLVSLIALVEISRSKNPGPELLALLDRMEGFANNTIDLAEEFLHLAHAESSENIQFNDVDLIWVAHNALEHAWAQAQKKGISLEHDFNVDEAWIQADANLVERALVNLLDNAIKYSPAQTQVKLSLQKSNGEYYCCISDHGRGIPKQEIHRLFDRFYRVSEGDGVTQEKGAGLGLAFVQAVAQRHNGKITVDSTPGEGSQFCLILPISAA